MHISEKNEPARAAGDRKMVNPPIAGDARYEIARSSARLIFVLNAHRFPAYLSNGWKRDTDKGIKSA
jgi:hypothetical protein